MRSTLSLRRVPVLSRTTDNTVTEVTPIPDGAEVSAPEASTAASASGAARLTGIDVARAIAILGMITQHITVIDDGVAKGWPEWIIKQCSGRASVLFFILSGVSLSLIHARGSRSASTGVLMRRGVILLIGGLYLTAAFWSGSILQHYGVMFLLAPLLVRASTRVLAGLVALGMVAGPILLIWLGSTAFDPTTHWNGEVGRWFIDTSWSLWVTGTYPLVVWIGFFALGMVIGRMRFNTRRVATGMAVVGVLVAVAAGAVAGMSQDRWPVQIMEQVENTGPVGNAGDPMAPATPNGGKSVTVSGQKYQPGSPLPKDMTDEAMGEMTPKMGMLWSSLADRSGHSDRTAWAVQSSGIALAVTGISLLVAERRRLRWLQATGSMALTGYLLHLVIVNDAWTYAVADRGWGIGAQQIAMVASMAILVAVCVVIKRFMGNGPAERLLKSLSHGASS